MQPASHVDIKCGTYHKNTRKYLEFAQKIIKTEYRYSDFITADLTSYFYFFGTVPVEIVFVVVFVVLPTMKRNHI